VVAGLKAGEMKADTGRLAGVPLLAVGLFVSDRKMLSKSFFAVGTARLEVGWPFNTDEDLGKGLSLVPPVAVGGRGKGFELPTGGNGLELPTGGNGLELPTGGNGLELPTGGNGLELPTGGKAFELPTGGKALELPAGGNEVVVPFPAAAKSKLSSNAESNVNLGVSFSMVLAGILPIASSNAFTSATA